MTDIELHSSILFDVRANSLSTIQSNTMLNSMPINNDSMHKNYNVNSGNNKANNHLLPINNGMNATVNTNR